MASASKTTKLNLPQWAAAEKPERTDFNAAFLALDGIIDLIYPVGSIYISTVATNPGTLFGTGTWAAFGAGKTLVGIDSGDAAFDTAEETGGAKTHKLTEAEMPAHRHKVKLDGSTSSLPGPGAFVDGYGLRFNAAAAYNIDYTTGGDAPHNNLQPYIVTYMWKRTA